MASLRFILAFGVFALLVAGAGYTSAQTSSNDLDLIIVNPDTAHYSIVTDSSYALQDDTVIRLGRSSGQVQGIVSNTCADKDDEDNIHWEGTYLCQVQVNIGANHGDSGCPVFKIASGDNVKLLGIVTLGNDSTYIYSPIGKVFLDLASTYITWDAGTSGC